MIAIQPTVYVLRWPWPSEPERVQAGDDESAAHLGAKRCEEMQRKAECVEKWVGGKLARRIPLEVER